METDPAPSGGGRLLHRASSAEWSLFLGVKSPAAGDPPLGHPSTVNLRLLRSVPSGAELTPNEFILPDQGYTFRSAFSQNTKLRSFAGEKREAQP